MIAPRLILITDRAYDDATTLTVVRAVGRALPPGALLVQLRDKERSRASLRVLASQLAALTHELGAFLAVNGDPDIACDAGADGVHLGHGAGSVADARAAGCRWVSVAAHSDADVRDAARHGADAVLVSPIFAVPGKSAPRGVAAIVSACAIASADIKVYALGGIDAACAASVRQAGAHGAAVIRAVWSAGDPARQARAIHDALVIGS